MRGPSRSGAGRAGVAVSAVALLAVALLAGAGCGTKKVAVVRKSTPVTTAPSTTTPSTTTPAPPVTNPIILSSSGNLETQTFDLIPGLAIFSLSYTGGDGFKAALLNQSGTVVSNLYNLTGNANGATALGVAAGTYSVSVTAGGQWTITISEGVAVNPQFLPLNTSGTGPQVTPFFQSSGANATVTMTYSGTSPFIVTLLSAGGETVSVLANETTGPFNGSETVLLRQGTIYVIDVEGNGPWTLAVQ